MTPYTTSLSDVNTKILAFYKLKNEIEMDIYIIKDQLSTVNSVKTVTDKEIKV